MNRFGRFAVTTTAAGIRCLSTAAKHQPPKKIAGTTGRYAGAVFTAASKAGILEKVENELLGIGDVIKKQAGFASFLQNPTISRQDKIGMVGNLIDETKFSHISRNLLMTLAANGRIADTAKIINAYADLMQASRGAVDVTIISAEPLKKKQMETIQSGVMSLVGAGKTVDIKAKVDESIMGGLQIMIGDQFLDLSVSSRVTDLSKSLDSA